MLALVTGCGSGGAPRMVTDETPWDASLLDVAGLDAHPDVLERPDVAGDDVPDNGDALSELPDPGPQDACQPSCIGRVCGDDGCGGTCGTCTDGKACQAGQCVCVGNDHKACCGAAVCWIDSCGATGDTVADCTFGCKDGACQACVPQCQGKLCGADGCGGECGVCAPGACDGMVWTPAGTCLDGACQLGGGAFCDDGEQCTTDTCDPVSGCAHFPRNGACDDGVPCTVDDACGALGCEGAPLNCDDGKVCTADGCDATTGACRHTAVPTCTPGACAVDGNCDDNDLCTRDKCVAGNCRNAVIVCDDLNPCTTDFCTRGPGYPYCTYLAVPKGTACDDGNVCTTADVCAAKACGGAPAACDDGLACTDDACAPATGCSHVLRGGTCLIDGACLADGQPDPLQACRVCAPATDTGAWTILPDWTVCGDGAYCRSGQCEQTCPVGYVHIPAGAFTMGSPETEPGRSDDETQHEVTISTPYCLKATEVTVGEWKSRMGSDPYASACGDACPVQDVSFWDAVAYCNFLSIQESLLPCYQMKGCSGTPGAGSLLCQDATPTGPTCAGYRLPSEAEWEYAARAGTTTATYNGTSETTACEAPNPVLDPVTWFCGNAMTNHPVKGKLPNAWGLYDMLGNAWEWTGDWYGAYPAGPVTDPKGPATGTLRVERGGGWVASGARWNRAAFRNRSCCIPWLRAEPLGFRPVRVTCGGIACPTVPGYTASCSAQQVCGYALR